ncbi:FG-GAP-like repeat-containing protein [Streptomyces sp. NPDC001941]|uniref:FG-GAP-like repeat-containing protein n=1 Tax=Streptomyces sp. NPDC001941 TaxID=3154659 RepID=UPI00331AA74A
MRVRAAVAVALAVGSGVLVAPAGAAAAAEAPRGRAELPDAGPELEIAPVRHLDEETAGPQGAFAGTSGYLAYHEDRTYTWTNYADGAVRRVVQPAGLETAHVTGDDFVVFTDYRYPDRVAQRDMRDGTDRRFSVPEGQRYFDTYGDVLVTGDTTSTARAALHQWAWRDGAWQEIDTAAYPDGGALRLRRWYQAESRSGLLLEPSDLQDRAFWLDRTGLHELGAVARLSANMKVTGRWIVIWSEDETRIWDTTDPEKPPRVFDGPLERGSVRLLGVIGEDLLYTRGKSSDNGLRLDREVVAVPLTGGPERVVLDNTASFGSARPDGSLMIARADAEAGQAYYSVSTDGAGGFAVAKVADIPWVPHEIDGVAFAQGRLSLAEHNAHSDAPVNRIDLPVDGPITAGPRTSIGSHAIRDSDCSYDCRAPLHDAGDGRVVHVSGEGRWLSVTAPDGTSSSIPVGQGRVRGSSQPRLAVSGRYAAARVEISDRSRIDVFDLDTGAPVRSFPIGNGGTPSTYALDAGVLWLKTAPGKVSAIDVATGRTLRTVAPSSCDFTALQVQASSLYWECGPLSGVYDTATGARLDVPDHDTALLGDGFIAWYKGGALSVTSLRGAAVTREVGRPRHRTPGIGWSVDRSSGRVVYVSEDYAVHVVPSPIPTSPLGVLSTDVAANKGPAVTWRPRWWISRPAASWRLTVADRAGQVVRTFTGGEARGLIGAEWDGKDEAGRQLAGGAYRWTLTAVPADGQGPDLQVSGTVSLSSAKRHDQVGDDGFPDVYARDSGGRLTVYQGDASGRVSAPVDAGVWNNTYTIVPFGDLTGDGGNDTLLANKAGELWRYAPARGKVLSQQVTPVRIGTGWQAYDGLTYSGDFNADGLPDLVARQSATGDLYLFAGTKTGGLARTGKIGTSWKSLTIVGAGDLNGDKHADLIARTANGDLYRYYGTGKGTIGSGTKIGSGWSGMADFVGIGDLTGDGKDDVLGRTKAGDLYRYAGTGKGTIGSGVKIGTGWKSFSSIR